MPPKRQLKTPKNETTKRKKKAPVAASSDSEFDSDYDNGNGNGISKPDVEEKDFTDENVDASMYPKPLDILGRLVIAGGTNWDLTGRKELPKAAKNAPNMCTGKDAHVNCLLFVNLTIKMLFLFDRPKPVGASQDQLQGEVCHKQLYCLPLYNRHRRWQRLASVFSLEFPCKYHRFIFFSDDIRTK